MAEQDNQEEQEMIRNSTEWPALASPTEVACLLGIEQSVFEAMVRQGEFPSPINVGGSPKHTRKQLVAWTAGTANFSCPSYRAGLTTADKLPKPR